MKHILLLFAIISLHITCEKTKEKQPNIILILTDDQGWGDLSINGNTNLQTPHIDQIGHDGVIFDRFYVSAVCSPTRAEILTGRYSPRTGVYSTSQGGERIDLDEVLISEIFKENGYATAAYGKWHSGMQAPYHPNTRGFDDYYGFCSGHWGNYYDPMLEHNGEIVKGKGFLPDDLTDRALNFIEDNGDKPFFLYLPYNTPHSPMQAPSKFWNKFKDKDLQMTFKDPEKEDTLFTKTALAMVENIDYNVGRINEKLKALQLEENTIVLFLSDNGPNGNRWNDGMKGRKGSTDEGGVRSPLMVKWPAQIEAGSKITQISSSVDLMPTLLSMSNITYKSKNVIDGMDLYPIIKDSDAALSDRYIYNSWKDKLSLRSQRFRLDHENQLFDMLNDPGQSVDVKEDFAEDYSKMLAAKKKWSETVLSELDPDEKRSFTIGYKEFKYNQIPARDANASGEIKRSNRWPNSSYFTNWRSTADSITWDAEVLEDGDFEVEVYYTCSEVNIGSTFELTFGGANLAGTINEAFDPPLLDKDDIYPRMEGYVKAFKPLNIGTISLQKGKGPLTLKATNIAHEEVMDFRLLMLKRI